MNDRIGNISFPVKKPSELGKKPYSDKLARLIDEVRLTDVKCNSQFADIPTKAIL